MKVAVDFFTRPKQFGLLIGALVSLFVCGSNSIRAQSSTLELRALANTKEDKDKTAVEKEIQLFAKAKNDPALTKKLQEAADKGVPPDLREADAPPAKAVPAEEIASFLALPGNLVDALTAAFLAEKLHKPAAVKPPPTTTSYHWFKVEPKDLPAVGIDLALKIGNKTLEDKLDEARQQGEPYELAAKKLLLYSRPGKQKGTFDYFLFARPTSAETSINSKLLEKVEYVPDSANASQGGVLINLNPEGKDKFKKFSEQNLKRYLLIVVDGKILHTVRLSEAIEDGELLISGRLSRQRASEMAARLQKCLAKNP